MNLWRRSISWFQDGASEQSYADQPEPCFGFQQEKEMCEKRHETERKMLGKQYHRQLLEAKWKFDVEMRRLEERQSRSNKKGIEDVAAENAPKDTNHRKRHSTADFRSLAKKNLMFEGDGLEWDPSDDLRSYNDDQIKDCSWELQCERSFRSDSVLLNGGRSEDVESYDSAYSSRESRMSTEFQGKFLLEDEVIGLLDGYQSSGDVERKVEQVRLNVRQEVLQECEEKFRQERSFLYSIIDELEENVSLLRKQKEDIVTIFEGEGKETAKGDEEEVLK